MHVLGSIPTLRSLRRLWSLQKTLLRTLHQPFPPERSPGSKSPRLRCLPPLKAAHMFIMSPLLASTTVADGHITDRSHRLEADEPALFIRCPRVVLLGSSSFGGSTSSSSLLSSSSAILSTSLSSSLSSEDMMAKGSSEASSSHARRCKTLNGIFEYASRPTRSSRGCKGSSSHHCAECFPRLQVVLDVLSGTQCVKAHYQKLSSRSIDPHMRNFR